MHKNKKVKTSHANLYDQGSCHSDGTEYVHIIEMCHNRKIPIYEANSLKVDSDAILGTGYFATVYSATINEQEKVACKVFRDRDMMYDELEILAELDHPNIVALRGCAYPKVGLLLEFMANGTLSDYILSQKYNAPDFTARKNMAQGILDGLLYLHTATKHGVLHFDLTPENILLDEHNQVKISDFGIAQEGKTYQKLYLVAHKRYRGPEAYTNDGAPYTQKMDIYIVALTLYLLLVKLHDHTLLPGIKDDDVAKHHKAGILTVFYLDPNKPVENVLRLSLNKDPNLRPDVTTLRETLMNSLKHW